MNIHLLPKIIPNEDTNQYWQNISKGNLTIQRCFKCNEIWAYPQKVCCNCLSTDIENINCRGNGVIYSFTIILRALTEALAAAICSVLSFPMLFADILLKYLGEYIPRLVSSSDFQPR